MLTLLTVLEEKHSADNLCIRVLSSRGVEEEAVEKRLLLLLQHLAIQ